MVAVWRVTGKPKGILWWCLGWVLCYCLFVGWDLLGVKGEASCLSVCE